MISRASLVAKSRNGVTLAEVVESRAPLAFRVTESYGPGLNVSMLHTGAGYLEGDRTSVNIEVGEDACLYISTPGSTIAFPCKGQDWSAADVTVRVRRGGFLAWLPEPLIATDACRHRGTVSVDLAGGAALVWREETIAGRSGESGGRLDLRFAADVAGRPLLREAVVFGPEGWMGPRTLSGSRFTGTVALLGRRMPEAEGVMQLAGPGSLARAVAPDALALRQSLDRYLALPYVFPEENGEPPYGTERPRHANVTSRLTAGIPSKCPEESGPHSSSAESAL